MKPKVCECGGVFVPRAWNQAKCTACRDAAGARVYSDFEPCDDRSFFVDENERRLRRQIKAFIAESKQNE